MRVRFDAPPGSATESQGLAVRYAAAKRRVSSWRWYLLFAAVVALPLYFGAQLLWALVWVTAPGQVELQEAFVKAGAAGHVAMLAAEGQRVGAGETLARVTPMPSIPPAPEASTGPVLRPPGAAASRAALGRELATARELAAHGALDIALSQLADSEHWRRTIAALVAQGAATAAEEQAARARREEADASVVRARAELAEARAAARRAQFEIAEAAGSGDVMAGASAAAGRGCAAAPIRAASTAGFPSDASTPAGDASWPVPAPVAGRVVRVSARSGDWVAPDSEVAVIQSEAPPIVRGWLLPADVGHAREGAEAMLHFNDGTDAPARVVRVEPEAARMPPERLGPLAIRGQALVILLQPLAPLPERFRVHTLPVDVRFRRW